MTKNLCLWIKKAIKWGLFLGLALAFGFPGQSQAFSGLEDFESYEVGYLTTQSSWRPLMGNYEVDVFENIAFSGTKSITAISGIVGYVINDTFFSTSTEGTISLMVYAVDYKMLGGWAFDIRPTLAEQNFAILTDPVSGDYGKLYYTNSADGTGNNARYLLKENYAKNEWFKITINWWLEEDVLWGKYQYADEAWTEPALGIYGITYPYINEVFIGTNYRVDAKKYFDYLTYEEAPPPELRVFGVSPASGSTISDIEDSFTIGWEAWDFEWIYKDFVFSFYQKDTGILVGTKIYAPATESGTKSYQFSDFGISKNGEYYFNAKARSYLYGYTAFYTTNLVSPDWWIKVDILGWEAIFEMPDFTTWYGENVERFATPTAIFTGITGFVSPIFGKIGEFGNNALSFLNLNEAYDRGWDLGKIIPLFRHYVSEIEVFFGGFPVIQIFLAFMVILLGIFIIRLILKFIPGLG